jgi:hypothetical protein
MTRRWRIAGLLLGAACASGSPANSSPTPAPSGPSSPRPSIDPARTDPAFKPGLQYPRTGGGILRYALRRRDSVTATMPSGETQLQILGRVAYLTLTWVAADTGTRITAVVDSIRADSGLLIASGLLDSARGARWAGTRSPEGRLRLDPGTSPSLAAAQVQDELLLLFPALPPEGAVPGGRWIDSTTGPGRVSAFSAAESVYVQGVVDTLPSATGALPLTLVRTRRAGGEVVQFGQPISVRATGTDTLAYQLAADGRILRVHGRRWTDLVVSLPSIGQSVPARESSTLLFTLLR